MFKRTVAAVAAALSVILLTGCSLTSRDTIEVTVDSPVPPKMLFLGDSIPAGYGLDGYNSDSDNSECRSYPNILRDKYTSELKDKCGHTMVNKAVSGATSSDLLELINSGELDADLADSDAIVVSIGGNDLLHLLFDLFEKLGYNADSSSFNYKDIDILTAASTLTTLGDEADEALDGFEKNLALITDALDERTDGTIYVQTLYDPLEYYTQFSAVTDFSSDKMERFNQIVTDQSEGNYKVVDVAHIFKGQAGDVTNIKSFDIHPNFIGHQLIADAVDQSFRETGFTYTTEEYGKEHLTGQGYAVIISGIILGFAALTVPAFLVGKAVSRKKDNK